MPVETDGWDTLHAAGEALKFIGQTSPLHWLIICMSAHQRLGSFSNTEGEQFFGMPAAESSPSGRHHRLHRVRGYAIEQA